MGLQGFSCSKSDNVIGQSACSSAVLETLFKGPSPRRTRLSTKQTRIFSEGHALMLHQSSFRKTAAESSQNPPLQPGVKVSGRAAAVRHCYHCLLGLQRLSVPLPTLEEPRSASVEGRGSALWLFEERVIRPSGTWAPHQMPGHLQGSGFVWRFEF